MPDRQQGQRAFAQDRLGLVTASPNGQPSSNAKHLMPPIMGTGTWCHQSMGTGTQHCPSMSMGTQCHSSLGRGTLVMPINGHGHQAVSKSHQHSTINDWQWAMGKPHPLPRRRTGTAPQWVLEGNHALGSQKSPYHGTEPNEQRVTGRPKANQIQEDWMGCQTAKQQTDMPEPTSPRAMGSSIDLTTPGSRQHDLKWAGQPVNGRMAHINHLLLFNNFTGLQFSIYNICN